MTSARRLRLQSALASILLSVCFMALPASVLAQELDALFRDFEPFGELQASLDGKVLEGAEVLMAKRAGAYLVMAPQLDQVVLVNARTKSVEAIAKDKVAKDDQGTAGVLADAMFESLGSFDIAGDQVVIQIAEGQLTLGPKPSLLGLQTAEALIEHNPSYGFKAEQYPPSADVIAELKKEKRDVVVRVYFGSWCPTCSRMVPWIVRVGQDLADSSLDFEYYGLPRTMDDPTAEAMDVHGVPTMVLMIDGKEIGRRGAEGLSIPEKAIAEILAGAS